MYRILKKGGKGRIIISDLITTKEIKKDCIDPNNWCSCIDGALTKENYLRSITDANFKKYRDIKRKKTYMNEHNFNDKRKIVSIIVKAITN